VAAAAKRTATGARLDTGPDLLDRGALKPTKGHQGVLLMDYPDTPIEEQGEESGHE